MHSFYPESVLLIYHSLEFRRAPVVRRYRNAFVDIHTCIVLSSYETTSSEESSGDEKPKAEAEEEDSSEPEVEKEKEAEPQPEQKPEEGAEAQEKDAEASAEGGAAVTAEKENERSLLDPDSSQELLEATAEG